MNGPSPALDSRQVLLRGVGVILLASFLFGAMAIFVRLAAREMATVQIAFLRFAGSFLVLLTLTRGRHLRPRPGNALRLVLRGLLGGSAIILYYAAIQGAGAGLATLIHCTYPVWTTLFAVVLMAEEFSRRVVIALLINLAGVGVIIAGSHGVDPRVTLGTLSALVASVLAGGAVTTARHLRATENASLITVYFMAVGALLTGPGLLMGLPAPTQSLVVAVIGVILTSVGGQWLLHQGLGFASATQGSLAAATSVVTAAGLEALLLGEHLSRSALVGACFMIVAVGLSVSGSRSGRTPERPVPVT